MAVPKPEAALDIVNIQTGLASQGDRSGVAVRFHLRDGSTLVCVLEESLATGFAKDLQERLAALRKQPSSGKKH